MKVYHVDHVQLDTVIQEIHNSKYKTLCDRDMRMTIVLIRLLRVSNYQCILYNHCMKNWNWNQCRLQWRGVRSVCECPLRMSRGSVILARFAISCAKMSEVMEISKLSVIQKDILIGKLFSESDILKNKLRKVEQERDSLLCEVNRLKFELQISDIKRLGEDDKHDARYVYFPWNDLHECALFTVEVFTCHSCEKRQIAFLEDRWCGGHYAGQFSGHATTGAGGGVWGAGGALYSARRCPQFSTG